MNYDAITPICHFNTVAGNHRTKRELYDQSIHLQFELILEEMKELKTAFLSGDDVGVVDGAADTIVTVVGLLHKLGLDPNEAMRIVNDANLSKYCYTPQEAIESVKAYEDDERYVDVHFVEEEPSVFVIKGRLKDSPPDSDWKILKGVNTVKPEPALQSLLDDR